MRTKIIWIGLALILVLGLFGIFEFNKKVKSINDMKVDFEISASELLSKFENDENLANSIYLDKVILVSGIVSKSEEKDNKKTVYLSTENELSNVIFQLEDMNQKMPEIGAVVNIKGICTGYLMDVVLVRAMIK